MKEETRDFTIGEALDYGCQMAMAGNHAGAIGLFKGVLMHEPNNFEAIQRLGSSLFELKEYEKALYWFWRGRKLNRKHPMALTNYGLCVGQLGHWDEAIADLERATHQCERHQGISNEAKALCYNNLGNTLEKLKRYPEALTALDKGIRYNPNDAFPHYNRGIVLLRLNRQAEGIAELSRAIAINPNDADAHYNRGMGRLLLGDFKEGLADYEYRLLTSENKVINLGLPAAKKWTGKEPLEGKTILVHCEQGLGDDIQFLRFMDELSWHKPGKTLLITHNAIKSLLGDLPGVTVLPPGGDLPVYDYWVALMSLPLCFGIADEGKIPAPWCPVIEAERVEKWCWPVKSPLKLNVGVCWAGNWLHKNNEHRSIPIEQFGAIFKAEGCHFASVQQIVPGEVDKFAVIQQESGNIHAFFFDDLRDTAAALLNCDLVVSVDTAVAHLSASLGIPTWILIPKFGTDWRWGLERLDSPWYPSARLIRQDRVGDWASTLRHVKDELEKEAERRAASRAA